MEKLTSIDICKFMHLNRHMPIVLFIIIVIIVIIVYYYCYYYCLLLLLLFIIVLFIILFIITSIDISVCYDYEPIFTMLSTNGNFVLLRQIQNTR